MTFLVKFQVHLLQVGVNQAIFNIDSSSARCQQRFQRRCEDFKRYRKRCGESVALSKPPQSTQRRFTRNMSSPPVCVGPNNGMQYHQGRSTKHHYNHFLSCSHSEVVVWKNTYSEGLLPRYHEDRHLCSRTLVQRKITRRTHF